MTKHCFPHLSSTRFIRRFYIVLASLCAFFPAASDAAKCGGGTTTTMVLSYAYTPPRWVARCDPLNVKGFQLTISFDPSLMVDQVTGRNPFLVTQVPGSPAGIITVMSTNEPPTSPGDVDIFEVVFKPTALSALTAAFVENFDGVVPPALPPGWTTTFSGAGTPVATSSVFPDTAPNDILFPETTVVGLSEVKSTIIAVPGSPSILTFRNLFNTEASHDGLVLEISVNGGPFQDIVAAGGSFVSGGYNSTLGAGLGNPLPGRMAWSGLSGGTPAAPAYITTVVNLPGAASGQNIQLQWRQGSDDAGAPAANPGSRIDTISIDPVPAQPPFTFFAQNSTSDFIDALETGTNPPQTVHFNASQITPTTRVFTPGVFPHIWDPDGQYNNGHTGGSGTWQNLSPVAWDDLPSVSPGPPPAFSDTAWDNNTRANDIAVFGGDPGSGVVTVCGPISTGGFQFDISGYDIRSGVAGLGCATNGALTLSAPPGLAPTIDTGASNTMISATIAGNRGLTKVGTGTLALTGPNTYTGPTTVNAGTLLVGGTSGTSNSPVIVNAGGVIGGNGLINGPVNVDSGGAVLGGNGLAASGTLTIANDLHLNPNSVIKLALGPSPSPSPAPHSSLARAGGTWTFAPNQAFVIINLGAQAPRFYDNIITGLDVLSPPLPADVASWHINNPGFNGIFSYDGSGNIDLNVTAVPPPLTLLGAVSRKTHGPAGTFDIPLPPVTPFGVECRSGGAGGNHMLVFTFTNNIVSGSASLGTAGTGSITGSPILGGNTMTVNLTGVSNVQLITVTLSGVTDGFAQVLPETAVSMKVLAGDVNGSGSVTATDISITKAQSGASAGSGNFREDVVANGTINGSDVSLVKAFSGTAVPKPAR